MNQDQVNGRQLDGYKGVDGRIVVTPLPRLQFDTPDNARKSVTRLMNKYQKGLLDTTTYKALCYGAQVCISALKVGKEWEIQAELEEIRDAIERRGKSFES